MARGAAKATPHYMDPLIPEYVLFRHKQGRQAHAGNESILHRFAKEWDEETRNEAPARLIDNLTSDWVEDYFLEMYGEREPVTKRAYKSQLRQFIVWMQRYGVSKDAADFNVGLTAGRSLRKQVWLSPEQMREVWETEEEVYWSTLFMFLALTCCRINEAQSARWGDLVGEQWNIRRKKTHDLNSFLRLSPRLREALHYYKMWYRTEIGRQIQVDDFIFPAIRNTVTERRISITNPKVMRGDLAHRKIRSMVVRCYPEYENQVGVGCHTLRRSGAQALLDAFVKSGMSHALLLVSKILGHDKTSTTESYLNVDTMKLAADQALETVDLFDDQEAEVIPLRLVREN